MKCFLKRNYSAAGASAECVLGKEKARAIQ
jgi:hypothetical protein